MQFKDISKRQPENKIAFGINFEHNAFLLPIYGHDIIFSLQSYLPVRMVPHKRTVSIIKKIMMINVRLWHGSAWQRDRM